MTREFYLLINLYELEINSLCVQLKTIVDIFFFKICFDYINCGFGVFILYDEDLV